MKESSVSITFWRNLLVITNKTVGKSHPNDILMIVVEYAVQSPSFFIPPCPCGAYHVLLLVMVNAIATNV